MKKSIIVAAIALAPVLFSAQAFAGDSTSTNVGGGAGGAGGVGNGGTGVGGNATGGTATATGGTASSNNSIGEGTASNQGVSNTSNFYGSENQRFHYSGGYKIKNTPDASLGGPASGPCNGFSGGLGFSGPGFAVGANTSTVDKGCEMRETARVAAMLGRMDLANAVLENIAIVQEALKAKAKRSDAPQAAEGPAAEKVSSLDKKASDKQQMAVQKKAAEAAIGREVAMRRMQDEIRFTTLETMDQKNNGSAAAASRNDQQTAQSSPAASSNNSGSMSGNSAGAPSAAAKSEPTAMIDQSVLDAEFKNMTAALQAAANADQSDADLSN